MQVKKVNKPKMVNAPEGLNQVILRKVRRLDCRIFSKLFFLPKTVFLPFVFAEKVIKIPLNCHKK